MNTQDIKSQSAWGNAKSIYQSTSDWMVERRITVGAVAFVMFSWQFYSTFLNTIGDHYFPSPLATIQQSYVRRSEILEGLLFTGSSAILGLILATVIGVGLGIVFAEFYYVRNGLFPVVVFLYSTPAAILAPIFIIWFGTGVPAVIAFATWTAFFPIFINTVTGLTSTKEEFEQLGSLFDASRIQMIRHIKIWHALPNIVSGIKVAVTLSMVGAIIAEYIATGSGLGGQIISGLFRFEEGWVFGVVITIGVFSIVLYKLTCGLLDRATPQNIN